MRTQRIRTLATLAALTLTLGLPRLARAEESWMGIFFHGKKVGYVRARESVGELEGVEAVHANRWSVITVRRRDQVIRMEHTLDAWFSPKGAPLRYTIERREAGSERTGEGYRDGDRFEVRQTVGGRLTTRSYPMGDDVRLATSLEWLFLKSPKAGAVYRGQSIDESEGDIQPFELSIGPRRDGKPFLVKEKIGGIESELTVDAKGNVLSSELVGSGITMRRMSREKAVRPEEAVDIFGAATFTVDAALPARYRLDGITLSFEREHGDPPKVPSYPTQTSQRRGSKVTVSTKVVMPPKKPASLPMSVKGELSKYLSGTDYEDLQDEKLIAVVEREVGDAKDAWTAAKNLNGFVHAHIADKTLAHAFDSATEALDAKAGDCTEHAVLFSALAKIAGIPTKLATGLVYVGGAEPSFGYHEWVEVWLGDAWHPMDPTFGQDIADATHVKLSEGLSDAEGLREAGLAASSLIGDVSIRLDGWVVEGKSVKR